MGCGSSKDGTSGASKPGATDKAAKETDKANARQENKDYEVILKVMGKVPILKMLPLSEHPKLAATAKIAKFNSGVDIVRQGEIGSDLYILTSGAAETHIDGQMTKLATADYFGDIGFLNDWPHAATVTATSDVVAMKISREDFDKLELRNMLVFPRRVAVAAPGKAVSDRQPTSKDSRDADCISRALKDILNLNSTLKLTDACISDLVKAAWKEDVANGTVVIKEGDLNADFFYIVSEGKFELTVSSEESSSTLADGPPKPITLEVGNSFGELALALLYLAPRAATVTATEDSEVFVIHRDDFKQTLMKVSQLKVMEYVGYLQHVQLFEPLLSDEKKALAEALVEMDFKHNENILTQGSSGNTFYILYEGEVEVKVDGTTKNSLKATPKEVKFFGEKALLNNEPRAVTVTVTSNKARTLVVDRKSFELLLGPLQEIISGGNSGKARQSMLGRQSLPAPLQNFGDSGNRIVRKDLKRVALLGCGGFGAVDLCEHETMGQTYALKAISKGYIVKTRMQESVLNEKKIMSMVNSPFIIKLYETYNSDQRFYFLMEPALGGELYSVYKKKNFYGSLNRAKFYAAGTICAFEHLHERRIIYRDLKPENILVTDKGHYKLTDMGLAKFVIGTTFTTCGTPDYFAPEVINNTGHTSAVDWWCLGILIFELMTGRAPFEAANPMQIYAKVILGIGKVTPPPSVKEETQAIIRELLTQAPVERLPMRPNGKDLLRKHAWFKDFDWEEFGSLRMAPPYVPIMKGPKDASKFSAREADMPPHYPYDQDEDQQTGWDNDFATHE